MKNDLREASRDALVQKARDNRSVNDDDARAIGVELYNFLLGSKGVQKQLFDYMDAKILRLGQNYVFLRAEMIDDEPNQVDNQQGSSAEGNDLGDDLLDVGSLIKSKITGMHNIHKENILTKLNAGIYVFQKMDFVFAYFM